MNSFTAMILICSMSTEGPDCSTDTAIDVIRGPDTDNPATCILHAESLVAGLARPMASDEYMKVVCRHRHTRLAERADDEEAAPRTEE